MPPSTSNQTHGVHRCHRPWVVDEPEKLCGTCKRHDFQSVNWGLHSSAHGPLVVSIEEEPAIPDSATVGAPSRPRLAAIKQKCCLL